MTTQEQKRHHREGPSAGETAPLPAKTGEQLKAELDEILDEIDEVLEENASEFVRNYVQKGGQ